MSAYKALRPAQRRFVDLMACGYKTQVAAMRELRPQLKRPDVLAAQWMALPLVQAAVEEREAIAVKAAGVRLAAVLQGLARNAYYDVRKLYHEDGRPKAVHELDDEMALIVQGVRAKTQTTSRGTRSRVNTRIEYSLPKRNEAYLALGRYLKLFTDRTEVTGKDGDPLVPALPSHADIARRIAFELARGMQDLAEKPSDPAIGATQSAERTPQQASEPET